MTSEIAEIAVDTSVLRELHADGPRASVIRELLNLARAGTIRLVARAGMTDDLPDLRIADLPIKPVLSNPSELGIDVDRANPSVLRELTLGDQHFESRFADIQMLAAARLPRGRGSHPDDWRGWDPLHFHLVNGHRYLVTLDEMILSVALDLGDRFDIKIMTPEEAVARFA